MWEVTLRKEASHGDVARQAMSLFGRAIELPGIPFGSEVVIAGESIEPRSALSRAPDRRRVRDTACRNGSRCERR
jgi:hypothetical protein